MLSYTSVDRMLKKFPMISSVTTITSADLLMFAEDAEAEVNLHLAKLYAVPVPNSPPILVSLATDIALFKVLSQRVFMQEAANKSSIPNRYEKALEVLGKIGDGEYQLVGSSGEIVAASNAGIAWSNTEGYRPTMNEGPVESLVVDLNKLADIASGQ